MELSEEGVSAQANQISSILKRPFVAGNRAAAAVQGVGKTIRQKWLQKQTQLKIDIK